MKYFDTPYMKLIFAFLRLIRSLNLFFIVLTQALFYYCIFPFLFRNLDYEPELIVQPKYFWLLVLSSVLIAAAGYVINDYFDLKIDLVNKPEKLVVDKFIKRRWTILWHWILSFLGMLVSFYISWKLNNWAIGIANAGCVFLLLVYSTTFKKKLLIGNLIISLLTSWVILVLLVVEWRFPANAGPGLQEAMGRLFKVSILYGSFAFIISLVREVVKDIEDMDGDLRHNATTMPVVWGVNVSKMFAAVWLVVLIAAIVILQFYVSQYRWWWSILYSFLLIIIPLINILVLLYRAVTKTDFHYISNSIKFVMFTGILSMLFFKLYS